MKSKNYKENLLTKLKNKEYRDAFVSEHIDTGIPFQIRALRKQRGLTQKGFEKVSGMKQTLISRLENVNYASFSLSTLKKISSLFNIGLIVRFVPISALVEWELNLNTESLKALSYEDDPYFKEEPEGEMTAELLIPENIKGLVSNNADYLDEVSRQRIKHEKQLKEKQELKKQPLQQTVGAY